MSFASRRRLALLATCSGLCFGASAFAQPANDVCGADQASFTIPSNGGTVTGTTTAATRDGAACAGTAGVDTYWYITPASSGNYSLTLCGTTPVYDMVLSIHSGCPTATGNSLACADDTCGTLANITSVALTGGTTYTIRVASWGSGRGPYQLVVNNLSVPGNCCAPAGTCTTTTTGAAGCPSGTTFTAGGVCSPNPCPQPPAGDICTGPIVIPAGPLPFNASVTGDNSAAGPTTNIVPAVCASSGRDVFYSFTPTESGSYSVTTCNSVTGLLDTVLSIHSACPGDGSTSLACSDDNCTGGVGPSTITNFAMSAGTTYIIRVARWNSGAGGPYRLDITTGAFGACCDTAAGTCALQSQAVCTGSFLGDGTTCTTGVCGGACCNDTTGICTVTGSANCASGSTFQGTGTTCTPNPCPQPPPPANDECANAIALTLDAPAVTGNNSGATQSQTGSCTGSTEDVWYSFNAPAAATFTVTADSDVGTLISIAAYDSCGGTELACTGALVDPAVLNVTTTAAGTVFLRVATFAQETAFTIQVVNTISGACCNNTTGACTTVTTGTCAAGATYQGDNTVCSPSPCPASGACCNDTTGTCTVTIQTACPSGSTYQGDGGVCSPNPCPQPPPPANDDCANAVTVTAGTPATTGDNSTATADTHTCIAGTNKGVWFSFTPTTAGTYQIDTNGSAFDTVLSVFDGCGGTELGCDDDSGTGTQSQLLVSVAANQNVRILVSAFGAAGVGGSFTLNIISTIAGACCDNVSGACTTTTTGTCAAGATYQGDNTACSPSPCPASGACCNDASGGCTITIQTACASGSTYQGDGSLCSPNPCPQPPPPANDECSAAIALTANVPVSGSNAQATGDGTEGPGGACYTTSPESFKQAVWFSFTAPTSSSYRVSACGSSFDTVLSVYEGTCTAFGAEVGCDDDFCDGLNPVGSGLASEIAAVSMTAGQTYLIRLSVWGPSASTGGAFTIQVIGDAGSSNIACCRGSTCSVVASGACTDPAGTAGAFATTATACNVGSSTSPCCYADYNKLGGIEVNDIFDFLNDWFAGSNFADTGGDGTTAPDVNSIFDFLNAWFAGGC